MFHLDEKYKINFKYKNYESQYPLVFIHGFGEDSFVWEKITPYFEEQNQSYLVFDLPGCGLSPKNEMMNSLEYLSLFLVNFFESLGIIKFHLLGHSMGGYIAMDIASQKPQCLESISLLYSTPFSDSEEKKEARKKSIEFIQKMGKEIFLKEMVGNLYTKDFLEKNKNAFEAHLQSACMQETNTLIAYYEAMINRKNNFETLNKLTIKKSWILGKQDNLIPYMKMLDYAASLDSIDINIDEKSGHMGMLENSEYLQRKILNFVL